jgi:hypothetical protein
MSGQARQTLVVLFPCELLAAARALRAYRSALADTGSTLSQKVSAGAAAIAVCDRALYHLARPGSEGLYLVLANDVLDADMLEVAAVTAPPPSTAPVRPADATGGKL